MSETIRKKAYLKPELTRIELKSEELLLTNCKLTSGGNATSGRARACSASVRCSSQRGSS